MGYSRRNLDIRQKCWCQHWYISLINCSLEGRGNIPNWTTRFFDDLNALSAEFRGERPNAGESGRNSTFTLQGRGAIEQLVITTDLRTPWNQRLLMRKNEFWCERRTKSPVPNVFQGCIEDSGFNWVYWNSSTAPTLRKIIRFRILWMGFYHRSWIGLTPDIYDFGKYGRLYFFGQITVFLLHVKTYLVLLCQRNDALTCQFLCPQRKI